MGCQSNSDNSKEQTPNVVQNESEVEKPASLSVNGEEGYKNKCFACHQANGEGIANTFPPLANSDYLMADRERAIKKSH